MSIAIPSRAIGAPYLDRTAGCYGCHGHAHGPARGLGPFIADLRSEAGLLCRPTSRKTSVTAQLRARWSMIRFPDLHERYPQTMVLLHVGGRRPLADGLLA